MAKRPIGVAIVHGVVQTPTSTPSAVSKPSGTATSTSSGSSGITQKAGSGGGVVYVPGQGGVSIAPGGTVPSGAVTGALGAAMAGAPSSSAVTTTTYLAGTKISSGGSSGGSTQSIAPVAPTSTISIQTSQTPTSSGIILPSTLTGQFAQGNVITSVPSGGQSQAVYSPSLWGTIKQTAKNVWNFGKIGEESFSDYYSKVKEPTLEYFKSTSNIYPNPVQWSGTQFGTGNTPFEYKDVSNLSPAQYSFQKDVEAFGLGMNPKYIGVYGDKAISQVSSDIIHGNNQAKINTGEMPYTGTEEETAQLQALAKQQYTEEFGKVQAIKAPTTQLIQTSEESKYFFGKGAIMAAEAGVFYGVGETETGMALRDIFGGSVKMGSYTDESLTVKNWANLKIAELKATPIELKLPSAELAKYEQGSVFRIFGEKLTPYGLAKQEMNFALTATKGTLGEVTMASESGIPTVIEKGKTYNSFFIRGGESTTTLVNPFNLEKMKPFTEAFAGGGRLTQFGEGAVYKAILPSKVIRLSPEDYAKFLAAKGTNLEFIEAQGKSGMEYFGFIEKVKGGKYIDTGLLGSYYPETKVIVIPEELSGVKRQEVIAHELIHHFTPEELDIAEINLRIPYKLQPSELIAYGLEKGYAEKGFKIISPEMKLTQVFGEDIKSAVGTGYIKIGSQEGFTEFKLAGLVKETPESYLVAGGTPSKVTARMLPSGELAPLKVRTQIGSYGSIAKLPEVEVGADYFSIQGTGAKTITSSETGLSQIQIPKSITGTATKEVSLVASYTEQAAAKLLPTIETKGTSAFTGTGQLLKTSTAQKQQFYTGDLEMDFQQVDEGVRGGLIQITPPIQVTPQKTLAGTWQPQVPKEELTQSQTFKPFIPTPSYGGGGYEPPFEFLPNLLPPFSMPSFFPESGRGRKYKSKKMKYKYQPSFASIQFGIVGKPIEFNVGGETAYGSFRPIIGKSKKQKAFNQFKMPKMKGLGKFRL